MKPSSKAALAADITVARRLLALASKAVREDRWEDASDILLDAEGVASGVRTDTDHRQHLATGERRYDCYHCLGSDD